MGRLSWVVWLAVPGLAGCTDRLPEWTGRVVEVEGVRHVENPPEPLASSGEVSQALRWSTNGPDHGGFWENPNKVHVYDDLIYLVDRRASRIRVITTNGELKPSIGEPGEGPGQYGRIIDAIPTEAGLFVVDGGNGRVEILTSSNELASSHPLGRVVFSAARLGDRAITVFGLSGSEQGWTEMDADGNRQPHEFPDFEAPEGSAGPSSSASTWGKRLVRLRYTSPQIRIYSGMGDLEQVFDVPLPTEEATDGEVEEIVRQVSSVLARDGLPSGVIQQQVDQIRARPREKLRFRKIVFDDDAGLAAIWEQNPEDFGSGNASLHLLSIDGIYLAELEFDRPWADFALTGAVLYVLSRDPATDLVTLMAHDLAIPSGLMDRARELSRLAR
jgi:hypothetical protein